MDDITATLSDIEAEDRVFRDPASQVLVKVKTLQSTEHSNLSQLVFKLTGSVCDASGKALKTPAGELMITPPVWLYHKMEGPADLGGELAAAQLRTAEAVTRAAAAFAALNGHDEAMRLAVATEPAFAARKAAEARTREA